MGLADKADSDQSLTRSWVDPTPTTPTRNEGRQKTKRSQADYVSPESFHAQLGVPLQKDDVIGDIEGKTKHPQADSMNSELSYAQPGVPPEYSQANHTSPEFFYAQLREPIQRDHVIGKKFLPRADDDIKSKTKRRQADYLTPESFHAQLGVPLQEEERQRHPITATPITPSQFVRDWEESEQIYVMGCDIVGRYIAHVLGSVKTLPPVRLLIHRVNLWEKWEEAGRQVTLYTEKHRVSQNRIEAEYMSMAAEAPIDGPFIENLIVTVPPGVTASALTRIKHRLGSRSTICLIHDGLGVAENLIETVFPDLASRPVFILGHMTTSLGHVGEDLFSVALLRAGRLYLSLFGSQSPLGTKAKFKKYPPMERVTRFKGFIRLLVGIPGLNASSHLLPDFLSYKLPIITFLSIADPLAALFDVAYDDLTKNEYTQRLVTAMLWEVCDVVAKLPECRNVQKFQRFYLGLSMHRKFFLQMHKRKVLQRAPMRTKVNRGWETDINYLTGYFVNRANELRVPVPNLINIARMIKAKRLIESERQRRAIPFRSEQGENFGQEEE